MRAPRHPLLAVAAMVPLLLGASAVSSGRSIPLAPDGAFPAPDSALIAEVMRADSAMFARFNAHDLPGTMAWFARDVEFFHDLGGLAGWGDIELGFRSNFEKDNGIARELLRESVRIHPIPRYGAMQMGAHRFCHMEGARRECATFEFTHVWRREDGRLRLARVVSYGH